MKQLINKSLGLGVCAWLFCLLAPLSVQASGGGDNGGPPEGVNYIPITPSVIVNFGGLGRMKYIKAELSLRAENATDAKQVIHHLPLIRDRLVTILSSVSEEQISSVEGKEQLRLHALSEINKALIAVEGHTPNEKEATDHKKEGKDKKDKKKKEKKEKSDKEVVVDEGKVVDKTAEDGKAVKGPASDLFFNNFVVQK